jgi:hypothetical protein
MQDAPCRLAVDSLFMKKALWDRILLFALRAILSFAAIAHFARAEEKPDAPVPKAEAAARQGPAGAGAQEEHPKKSPLEQFLGFRRNLAPFETPSNAKPLSPKQKYAFSFHQAEDLKAHIGNVLQAAVSQGFDSQPHYGQGWGPYAERFGAAEADQVTSCFFIYGFFPHIMKTDPRYFRKKTGSLWSRINYATSRTLVTRKDSGGLTVNTPQVLGQLFQSGISTAYYPERDRGPGQVFQSYGLSLLLNSGYNVASEFYPDIWHKVFRQK